MKFLKHGPEIVVGTPGRVIDLLDRRIINFDNIRFVVLDEVDRMLDIGFRDDIRNILSRVKGMRGRGCRRMRAKRPTVEVDARERRARGTQKAVDESAATTKPVTRRSSSPRRSATRSKSSPGATCASRSRS